MRPLWRHDGVLEYESLDGFAIRMVRKGNRLDVDCTRDGQTAGIGVQLGPDFPPDEYLPVEAFEAAAIGAWKASQNMQALARGEPRPFTFPGDLSQRRKKKGNP